jgi:hypothetical protein
MFHVELFLNAPSQKSDFSDSEASQPVSTPTQPPI